MTEEAPEEYRSGLPGPLGMVDLALSKIEAVILALGVILMAVNTCVNVIARFVFQEGLFWSGEANRILIIMITFAGIGYAARHGRHIRMTAFYDLLPRFPRKLLMIFIALVTGAVMFFLCYYSIIYIAKLYDRGRILPALGLPIWAIYVWVPIGFGITGVQYFLTAIKNITARDVYISTGVSDGYIQTESPSREEHTR